MNTPVRVLLVEDNPHDAELILRRLAREGFDVTSERVDNESDFRQALRAELDLVLCDYSLPRFSGMAALAMLRALKPDLPLILVSGTIGEDAAVAAMRQGAVDYLLKDRLERLGSAVRRALEQGRLSREHQRAQSALALSELRFRQLTEYIEEVFWIADAGSGGLQYVSPAFERIWGRSLRRDGGEASMSEWPVGVHPDDVERVGSTVLATTQAPTTEQEYRIVRPDGEVRVIHDRSFAVRSPAGELVSVVGVANDVTRARELEEQFRQSQRMEAIGQLAGGVAHDFNNLLSVILGTSAELRSDCQLPEEVSAGLEEIGLACERAAALTRQLLVFSRRDTIQTVDLDLNELVRNVSRLLARALGEHVSLELSLTPEALPMHADSGGLEQVILNLAVNARDAMPDGGKLIIETQRLGLDQLPANSTEGLASDRYALLRVQDTGCGIPKELQSRVFEPFFTTKSRDKGTGLGLATLYTIVRRHHGAIELTSLPGRGATFSIYLPCSEPKPGRAVSLEKAVTRRGAGETILLVEDDRALRRVATAILTRLGYSVLQAESGAQALDLWRDHAERIQVVLTDLVMPGGISGRELARRLCAGRKGLKVVYTSGYSDELAGRQLTTDERFLPKPFTPDRLAEVVRACFDSSG